MSLKKIVFSFIISYFCSSLSLFEYKPFIIILDPAPAGDTNYTGRIIDNTFERGLTLQYAQALKKIIEDRIANVQVMLTRQPGQATDQLHNAHMANRLDVDLYISINFFQEKEERATLYLYHFLYNGVTDRWAKPQRLLFYPFDQAHLFGVNKTMLWGEQIKNTLKHDSFKHLFEVKGLFGIPFRPLIGIQAPAIALEIGCKDKNKWELYLEPVYTSLKQLMLLTGSSGVI